MNKNDAYTLIIKEYLDKIKYCDECNFNGGKQVQFGKKYGKYRERVF